MVGEKHVHAAKVTDHPQRAPKQDTIKPAENSRNPIRVAIQEPLHETILARWGPLALSQAAYTDYNN
jgi:hypothetical protein